MADEEDLDLGGGGGGGGDGVLETKAPDGPAYGDMRDGADCDTDSDDEDGGKDGSYAVFVEDALNVEGMVWKACRMGLPGPGFTAIPNKHVLNSLRDVVTAGIQEAQVKAAEETSKMDSLADALAGFDLQDTDGRAEQQERARQLAEEADLARSDYEVRRAVAESNGITVAPPMVPKSLPGTHTLVVPPSLSYELRRRCAATWITGRGKGKHPADVNVDHLLDVIHKNVHTEALRVGGSSNPGWYKDRYFTHKWTTVGVTTRSCRLIMTNGIQFVAVEVQAVVAAIAAATATTPVDAVALAEKCVPLTFTVGPFHRVGHSKAVVHGEYMTVVTPEGSAYSIDINKALTSPGFPMPDPYASPFAAFCPGVTTIVHAMASADYLNPPEPIAATINPPPGTDCAPIRAFFVWCPTAAGAMAKEIATTLQSGATTTDTVVAVEKTRALRGVIAREAAAGLLVVRHDTPNPADPGPFDFKVGAFTLPLVTDASKPNTPQGIVAPTWARHPSACAPLQDVFMGKTEDTKAFAAAMAKPPSPDKSYPLLTTAETAEVMIPGPDGKAVAAHRILVFALHNNTVFAANPDTATLTAIPVLEEAALDSVQGTCFIKSALFTCGSRIMTMSVPGTLPTSVEVAPPMPGDLMPPPWIVHMARDGSDPPRAAKPKPKETDGFDDGGVSDVLGTPTDDTTAGDGDACVDDEDGGLAASGSGKMRKRGVTFKSDLDKLGDARAGAGSDALDEDEATRRRTEAVTSAALASATLRAPWGTITGVRTTTVHPAKPLNTTTRPAGQIARNGMGSDRDTVLGMRAHHVSIRVQTPAGPHRVTYILLATVTVDYVGVFAVNQGVEAECRLRIDNVCDATWHQAGGNLFLHTRSVLGHIDTFKLVMGPKPEPAKGIFVRLDRVNLCIPTVDTTGVATSAETDTITTFGHGGIASWSRLQGITVLIIPAAKTTA